MWRTGINMRRTIPWWGIFWNFKSAKTLKQIVKWQAVEVSLKHLLFVAVWMKLKRRGCSTTCLTLLLCSCSAKRVCARVAFKTRFYVLIGFFLLYLFRVWTFTIYPESERRSFTEMIKKVELLIYLDATMFNIQIQICCPSDNYQFSPEFD